MEEIRKGRYNSSDDGIQGNILVTISIGIARMSSGADKRTVSYKYLFRQADTALYIAKKKGKNTFHIINL